MQVKCEPPGNISLMLNASQGFLSVHPLQVAGAGRITSLDVRTSGVSNTPSKHQHIPMHLVQGMGAEVEPHIKPPGLVLCLETRLTTAVCVTERGRRLEGHELRGSWAV